MWTCNRDKWRRNSLQNPIRPFRCTRAGPGFHSCNHLHSKLAPTLLKGQTSMSKEVLVTVAGSQASRLHVYYIYTSWGDRRALPTARFCRTIVHAARSGCNITLPTDSYLCQWPRSYRQHSATSLHTPWQWHSWARRGCWSRWMTPAKHLSSQSPFCLDRCRSVLEGGFCQ